MIRAGNGAPGPEHKRCWGSPSSLKSLGNTGVQYLARPDPNRADMDQNLYPPKLKQVWSCSAQSLALMRIQTERSAPKLHFHSWNWTRFQPFLARIDPKRLTPLLYWAAIIWREISSFRIDFFKAVLKVSPSFVCVCVMQQCLSKRYLQSHSSSSEIIPHSNCRDWISLNQSLLWAIIRLMMYR